MTQTINVKLRLRDKHSAELNRQAQAVNYVWNYINETSRKAWSRDRRWLSAHDFGKLTSGSSKLLDLHAHTIKRVCDQFAISRDKSKRAGLRWRSRRSLGWIPFNTGHVSFDGYTLKFRGVEYVPMHLNPRLISGVKIGAGSFSADSKGRWFINLPVKEERIDDPRETSVGIDIGLKAIATLSDGTKIEAPRFYRASEETLALAQRARKSTQRIRNIHKKIANRRKDFLHKVSAKIAKDYGNIVIGDVSPKKLAQTRMAKSVHDAGWSMLRHMLSYKAIRHGGSYVAVNEYMSTQTCSTCRNTPPSRPKGIAGLGIREWRCDDCGTVHDRDVNAARNILRVGQHTLAGGAHV